MNRQFMVLMGFIVLAAFFAMPAYGQTQAGETGAAADQPSVTLDQQTGGQGAAGGQMALRASEMMGVDVKDQQGNSVGKIEDLILSDQGDIQYVVLARGGVMGIGGEMVPVPWDKVNAEGVENITLSLNDQELKDAPSFSKGDWDQMAPADFEQQVRGYYGGEQQPSNEPIQPGMEGGSDSLGGEQQTQ